MKTPALAFLALLGAASLAPSIGCARQIDEPSSTVSVVPEPPAPSAPAQPITAAPAEATVAPDPFAEITMVLDQVTLDDRDGLTPVLDRMEQSLRQRIESWKASGGTTSLAAEEKLSTASENFAQKLKTLSMAGPETWETAMTNVEVALQDLRSAYTGVLTANEKK